MLSQNNSVSQADVSLGAKVMYGIANYSSLAQTWKSAMLVLLEGDKYCEKTLNRNKGVYSKNKPWFKSAIVGPREVFVGAHRSGSTQSWLRVSEFKLGFAPLRSNNRPKVKLLYVLPR